MFKLFKKSIPAPPASIDINSFRVPYGNITRDMDVAEGSFVYQLAVSLLSAGLLQLFTYEVRKDCINLKVNGCQIGRLCGCSSKNSGRLQVLTDRDVHFYEFDSISEIYGKIPALVKYAGSCNF